MATTMEPETETPARPAPRPSTAARPKSSRRTVFMIMGVILVGILIFGVRKWWFSRSHVSTDNAQVDGHIVPILPKVGGFVAEVRVEENHAVKAGDTLVVLDDRDLRARLAQTEADLAALLATVSSRGRVGQAEAAVAPRLRRQRRSLQPPRRCWWVRMRGSRRRVRRAIRRRCSSRTRVSRPRRTAWFRRKPWSWANWCNPASR